MRRTARVDAEPKKQQQQQHIKSIATQRHSNTEPGCLGGPLPATIVSLFWQLYLLC